MRGNAHVRVLTITCDMCRKRELMTNDDPVRGWWTWHATRGRLDADRDDSEYARDVSSYDFCSEDCARGWFSRTKVRQYAEIGPTTSLSVAPHPELVPTLDGTRS